MPPSPPRRCARRGARPGARPGARTGVRQGARRPGTSGPARWVGAGRLRAALGLVAVAAAAACSSPAEVPVAPFADDPTCARVLLALPEVLADVSRIETTSQGTAAWGADGEASIVLRCGVDPLPPTTEQCVTATDDTGASVDWVAVPADEDAGTPWTFTTYGRLPAVELTVRTSVTSEQSQSFLVDLGRAVSAAEQTRRCL